VVAKRKELSMEGTFKRYRVKALLTYGSSKAGHGRYNGESVY
jgi:hypothetical protein